MIAGPYLFQPCSSQRMSWSRTGAPASFDISAADSLMSR